VRCVRHQERGIHCVSAEYFPLIAHSPKPVLAAAHPARRPCSAALDCESQRPPGSPERASGRIVARLRFHPAPTFDDVGFVIGRPERNEELHIVSLGVEEVAANSGALTSSGARMTMTTHSVRRPLGAHIHPVRKRTPGTTNQRIGRPSCQPKSM
jgi:hypothetical protein